LELTDCDCVPVVDCTSLAIADDVTIWLVVVRVTTGVPSAVVVVPSLHVVTVLGMVVVVVTIGVVRVVIVVTGVVTVVTVVLVTLILLTDLAAASERAIAVVEVPLVLAVVITVVPGELDDDTLD
jgi:hypothetical protein